jgi:hypothetical protein
MTKLSIREYFTQVKEKEDQLIQCEDLTKRLPIYIEFIQYKLNHSYILQELPYYYIRSIYDWINSSIIYVEYCLSIVDSRACLRLLVIKQEIIELISKIIEITSGDYDNLCKLYQLLIKSNEFLENLHPSLITTPSSRNNIHLVALTIVSNGEEIPPLGQLYL